MKYELRRKSSQHILLDIGIIIISIIGLVLTEGESIVCVFVGLMASGFLVNEIMRSKEPKLTFDETGFYIGEMRYSYESIEKVSSRRDRNVTFAKIIIDGDEVYKFDASYENAQEFVRQLTLHNVEHRLFS